MLLTGVDDVSILLSVDNHATHP